MKRKPIPKKVIEAVLERSGGLCEVIKEDGRRCCAPLGGYAGWRSAPHHIIFKSHMGPNTKENLLAVCGECHDRKHNR